MATFELFVNLPVEIKQHIRDIQAKASADRTTAEAAVLTTYDLYINNKVVSYDADDNIVIAQGTTLPTSYSGFAKSAQFLKTNVASGTKALYENVGDTSSASWNLIGEISTAEIGDEQVTAAKLASVLDMAGKAITSLSIEEGTPVNAVAAVSTLTFSGSVSDGEIVTIGTDVYEFDTDASVTGDNIAVDVSGGATAPDAVTALVAMITANATEPVSAVDGSGDTVVVTADVKGTDAESIVTTTDCANGAWDESTLANGVDGTVGNEFEVLVDTSYLYFAIAANTVADANWRRVTLGSAY